MSYSGLTNYVLPNDSQNENENKIVNNARDAHNVSKAFGMPLDAQGGMWANILPHALQIEEHKKTMKIASEYQKKYIEDFRKRYGFTETQLEDLHNDFKQITDQITELIPDGDMKEMYKKYVKSYPTMYLSMIPQEALQAKLAVKCVTENRALRSEIEEMSKCVSTLVRGLSKLQMAAGVPPIVNLMFETMPDPLTSITDPMYQSYNSAITTYHMLLDDSSLSSQLRSEPVTVLEKLIQKGKYTSPNTVKDENGSDVHPTIQTDELIQLKEVINNLSSQSGCQPFGEEWNHMGPEPAMNPAMCVGEHATQAGNPRHPQGRTAVYKATRTQDGGAQWVLKGQVPLPGVTNHMQMAPGHPHGVDPWAGYPGLPQQQAPRVRRTKAKKSKGKKRS